MADSTSPAWQGIALTQDPSIRYSGEFSLVANRTLEHGLEDQNFPSLPVRNLSCQSPLLPLSVHNSCQNAIKAHIAYRLGFLDQAEGHQQPSTKSLLDPFEQCRRRRLRDDLYRINDLRPLEVVWKLHVAQIRHRF